MSDDWLDQLLIDDPVYGESGPAQDAEPDEGEQSHGANPGADAQNPASPASSRTMVRPAWKPSPPHQWGSGRKADPYLEEIASDGGKPVSKDDDLAVKEGLELRKHEESTRKPEPEPPSEPPQTEAPDRQIREPEETPETETAKEETDDPDDLSWAARLRRARKSLEKPEVPEPDPQETRRAVAQRLAKDGIARYQGAAAEILRRRVVEDESEEDKCRRADRRSFVWATAAAWAVSSGTLIAVYDRVLHMVGTPLGSLPRASYILGGGDPHSWDLLEGPAPWLRDTVRTAHETGQFTQFVEALALGAIPVTALMVGSYLTEEARRTGSTGTATLAFLARWASWASVLGAAAFIAFLWHPQWWEVYTSCLVATAAYGWMMTKRIRSRFLGFLFRIPVAAAVTGILAYSPGAVW